MGLYLLSYLCMFVSILATAYLVYRQITLPVHVRWELYPVQHETASRVAYGGSLLGGLIVVTGWSGLILGNIGSLGLLHKRWTDPELRTYSSFSDYFNLLFI